MSDRKRIGRDFRRYSSRSMLAQVSMSFYYIVDTFFIARAAGEVGLAAINITSPVYYLIYAFAAMLSAGSAILFRIKRSRGEEDSEVLFGLALFLCFLFSLPFVLIGFFWTEGMVGLFGGQGEIAQKGVEYIQPVLLFSPLFMVSYVYSAFIRNDNDPDTAMRGTLYSSLFNIVADYVLMFPLGMGLRGAALATAFAPIVNILYAQKHFRSRGNSLKLRRKGWRLNHVWSTVTLGFEGFSFETSAAIVILVFNYLLLAYGGDRALAAYGVIANVALFVRAGIIGLSEGGQPLYSWFYGKDDNESLRGTLHIALAYSFLMGCLVFLLMVFFSLPVARLFSNGDDALAQLTARGLWMYFSSFLFASVNIVSAGYFSAVEEPKKATILSFLRGLFLVVPSAFLMARAFGLDGIWLSLTVAEGFTLLLTLCYLAGNGRKLRGE